MTHVLLLGATGRTGNLALVRALDAGHQVTALVRNPTKLAAHDSLTTIAGTPESLEDVRKAAAGTDATIVALNNVRTSDMPWAKQVSPPRFMADSVGNVVTAMGENDKRRIVVISAIGVGDSMPYANGLIRFLVKRSNLGLTYADHNLLDSELRATDTDWTLIRPVGLTNNTSPRTLHVTEVGGPKPGSFVSRTDVARFAVDALNDPTYVRRAPIIWSTK